MKALRRHPWLTCLHVAALVIASETLASASWQAGGTGDAFASAARIGRPDVPTVTVLGDGSVLIAWTPITDRGLATTVAYRVLRKAVESEDPGNDACGGPVAASSCVESSVPPGTWRYSVTPVLARAWVGVESDLSDALVIPPPEPSPSASRCNPGCTGSSLDEPATRPQGGWVLRPHLGVEGGRYPRAHGA